MRVALVMVIAAATAAVLMRDPQLSPGPSLLWLLVAFLALAALLALELRHARLDRRVVLGAGAGLLVLAVAVPPTQSNDVWSYAMYGRMVAHYHASPYKHVPAEWPADRWTHRVHAGWRHTKSVYGPVFTAFSAVGMATVGRTFLGARLLFQVSAALAVALALWLLLWRTRGAGPLALIALNPLVIVSVVNGGHNDALVGLAVLAGVVLAARRHPVWAGAALAGAALVKAAAALPLLAVALWVWRRHGSKPARQLLGTAVGAALVGYLLAGGPAALQPLHEASLDFSGASIWYAPRRWMTQALHHHGRSAGAAGHLARTVLSSAAAVFVAGLAFLLVRRRLRAATPALAAGAAAFAYVLAGAYILPWYAYWGLPALALAWRSRLTWLVAVQGAVLCLAAVPDLTLRTRVDPLYVATPLQRLRTDVYVMATPMLLGLIVIGVLVASLWPERRLQPKDYASSALLPGLGASEEAPTGSSPLSTSS